MVSLNVFANDNYFIHANRLNVRNAPDGKIIGKLQLNQTVEIVGSSDGWYEINFKGTNAFVSKSFVKNRRFTKKDGLKKWFELNPNSEITPVTLKHIDGFVMLCEKRVLNGEYLHVSVDNIYSDDYICRIAGCSDTIWLKNEQILVDWSVIAKFFPRIDFVANTTNQTETDGSTNDGDGSTNWTPIIIVYIIVFIVYRYWKKRNFVDSNDRRGTQWVYAVSNPAFGGDIYKIGMTTRPNLKARIRELSKSTSIPTEFELEAAIKVIDAPMIEKRLHRKLARYRINKRREFFQIELSQIIHHFEKYGRVYTK
jgi:hypothetical protein